MATQSVTSQAVNREPHGSASAIMKSASLLVLHFDLFADVDLTNPQVQHLIGGIGNSDGRICVVWHQRVGISVGVQS